MAPVGLADSYKYGGKFLGYLLVALVFGGVPAGAGAYVVRTGGASLTDPSVAAFSDPSTAAGGLLVVAGALVALAGVFGLLYKLVADATASGVDAALPDEALRSETAAVEDESGDSAPAEAGSAATDPTADESADVPAESSAPETTESEPVEPDAGPLDEAGAETVADAEPDPVGLTAVDDETADEPTPGTAEPVDGADEPFEEPWTGEESAEATEGGADETATGDASAADADEPEEWTPPDPSEFEQPEPAGEESTADDGPDSAGDVEAASGEGSDRGVEEPTTDIQSPSVESDDEPAESAQTWEDLQSGDEVPFDAPGDESAGEAEPPSGDDPADPWESAVSEADALTDPDGDDAGSSGADADFGTDADVADETSDDAGERSSGPNDEDEATDTETLADEGVESFEVSGDDDPLSDALGEE